jgi:ubiquinone/menaquinone biosynthesis C-methylase UbiE
MTKRITPKKPGLDYNAVAADYARNRDLHAEVLKRLLATGRIGAAQRVLELGCGTGNYSTAIRSLIGCRCWGLDRSAAMIFRAKSRPASPTIQLGDAQHLGYQSRAFDLVFSVDLIHHVERHLAYYREAHHVLKFGGRLCSVTDSAWIIRHRQPLATYFPETIEVELERYPAIAHLRALMKQVGFERIFEESVELEFELSDIRPYQEKAFSALHLIPDTAYQRGIERMAHDLRAGPIPAVSRYVLLWGTK